MRATQPVSIGGVEFDALIDCEDVYESEVPEYATEKGYSVSDSIIVKGQALNMTLFVTDTPVTWATRHGVGSGRSEGVIKQLTDMYFQKQPVEVVTSDTVYSDMAIESLSIKKSAEAGYAKEITANLKKILITETATTTIPDSYGKAGKTGKAAGSASKRSGSTGGGSAGASDTGSASQDTGGTAYTAGNYDYYEPGSSMAYKLYSKYADTKPKTKSEIMSRRFARA